ncbi:hypothetical protein LTR37_014463 [Vermiconidia calcicola]|uniref:Uncharacterized protein n=1 Tax=Vermiconidia calcicola TaxID=1690605 RepID=A0ACC3MV88_9PEZI|nr:hypothetical protein LTR37_014463 [Vermiconidia calcicola]
MPTPAPNGVPPPPSNIAAPSGPGPLPGPLPPNAPLITVGGQQFHGSYVDGQTLAANTRQGGEYTIGGQILTRGGEVTYRGAQYSLASNGRTLVVDGEATAIEGGGGGYRPNFRTAGGYSSYSSFPASSSGYYGSSSVYGSSSAGPTQPRTTRALTSTGGGSRATSSVAAASTSSNPGPVPANSSAAILALSGAFGSFGRCCVLALTLLALVL